MKGFAGHGLARAHRVGFRGLVTNPSSYDFPLTIPALLAGAVYVPGLHVSSLGGGSSQWDSLPGTQSNPLTDSHTGYKPQLVTLANGEKAWDLESAGATSSWGLASPGSAFQWTQRGSYAAWFRCTTLDTAIQYLWLQWPGGGTNNRLHTRKNNDLTRLASDVSWLGSAYDAGQNGQGPIGGRAKYNSTANIYDWTQWHFVRVTFDWSETNSSAHGANFSDRQRVFVDEVLDPGTGYSAPATGSGGSPEEGGPIHDPGLYASTAPFWFGSDTNGSSHWKGLVGPLFVANDKLAEDFIDEITLWSQLMAWHAPITL